MRPSDIEMQRFPTDDVTDDVHDAAGFRVTAEHDSVRRILTTLDPASAAVPVIYVQEHRLFIAYRTEKGAALLLFRSLFAHRFGYPGAGELGEHRLFDRGLDRIGIFLVVRSQVLVGASAQSWIGQHIPTTESWNNYHYAVGFSSGLLECVAGGLSYLNTSDGCSPDELIASHIRLS